MPKDFFIFASFPSDLSWLLPSEFSHVERNPTVFVWESFWAQLAILAPKKGWKRFAFDLFVRSVLFGKQTLNIY